MRGLAAGAVLAWALIATPVATSAAPAIPAHLSVHEATRLFLVEEKVQSWLRHYPRQTWVTSAELREADRRWRVNVFSGAAGEVATGLVDDASGAVVEAWTGPQVAWPLARGPGLGGPINHLEIWLLFCAVFLAGLANLKHPLCLRNLDLVVLLSFSVPLWFFNHGRVFAGVVLTSIPLVYLLVRCTWIGWTNRSTPPASVLPLWVLVAAALFLVGFRVELNLHHSGVLDVGYAGVIGADLIDHFQDPYGRFPVKHTGKPCGPANADGDIGDWVQSNGRCESANSFGDTYGPVNYESYLPGLWLFGWSGKWDRLPAVHFTTLLFDMLAMLGLAAVGLRHGGTRLAAILALAWAAYPFTQYVSSSNTNDAIMPALLVWGFWATSWDAGRGIFAALASWTKLAALIVVPLWLTYPGPRGRRGSLAFGIAFALTTALSFWVLFLGGDPLHEARVFYERTFDIQFDRHSPFSLWDWGQYHAGLPDLRWEQHALQALLVVAAVAIAFVPRRKSPLQLAALTGALLIAFELLLTHWSSLYISWFFPFVALTLLAGAALRGDLSSTRTPEAIRSSPRSGKIGRVEYAVVGSGAIGGTVGARLARDGHSVLFCDVDAAHVEAMNEHGLAIEGPVEEFTAPARAVLPEDLPDHLAAVLLAVKAHDTASAMTHVAPRLAADGFVVSLQNGLNEPVIAAVVGPQRTVGAFVNFGADYTGPGRIFLGGRGSFRVGELDGRRSERVERLARDFEEAEVTDNIMGYLWAKEAYGAILFATAVSDLAIADALAEPRYRSLYVRLAEEVLAAATAEPERFDGFDPSDLEGSIERLVEFNRHSAKTHSGIYRDLAVRGRRAETAIFDGIDGPLLSCLLRLVHEIEEGRRACEGANLELLAAYAGCLKEGLLLNAVITLLEPSDRSSDGPLHGVPVAIKDNIDVRGVVTTNASTVGVPPPADRDATVVARLREAGAELLCKTNLLEYAAGSVNPAYGMTFNPRDPSRTSGGSSSGSAALVAAGVCDYALGTDTGGSIRIPAAYCGIVGLKPTYGLVPLDGVFPLSPTLDHVGPLTRNASQAAALLGVIAGRPCELRPISGTRIGVLRRQVDDPAVEQGVRSRVEEALERLRRAGFELVDVDVPELDLADEALDTIVVKEAFDVHRDLLAREGEGYGSGTRAVIEAGREVTAERYEQALADRRRIADGFARVLETVDVLAGPTVAYPAPLEDPPVGTPQGDVEARFTGPYNLAGIPAVSVPCGLAEGELKLPAGLQLAAAAGADDLVLSVAAQYEAVGA